MANAIVTPDVFEQNRFVFVSEPFLLIEGRLQKQDNVISVKAESVSALDAARHSDAFPRFSLSRATESLPNTPYSISFEHRLSGDKRDVLGLSLRDENTIKRILERTRQQSGAKGMFESDPQ